MFNPGDVIITQRVTMDLIREIIEVYPNYYIVKSLDTQNYGNTFDLAKKYVDSQYHLDRKYLLKKQFESEMKELVNET